MQVDFSLNLRSYLMIGMLLCAYGAVGTGETKELIILGGEEGRPWQDGGGGIAPVIVLGPQEITNENVPGGIIDFSVQEGWIFPEKADQTDNIALQLLDRGGSVTAPTVLTDLGNDLLKMIDDDANSAFERKSSPGQNVRALGVVFQFDLGARFGVSRIRFFPRNADPDFLAPDFPFQDDYMRAYEIFLNDGTRETLAAGLPVFTSVLLVLQNDQPVVDVQIEPQYVRYIQLKSQTTVGFEIGEFQVFGEGFVPTAAYHSDVFDLGENLALWGHLRWEEASQGDPIRSQVPIGTRSGFDDSPVVFNRLRSDLDGAEVPWKTAEEFDDGSQAREIVSQLDSPDLDIRQARLFYKDLPLDRRNEISLTQADYKKLRSGNKGSVRDDLANWSAWSPPYSAEGITSADNVSAGMAGVPIVSPAPRRYFQFKVDYLSEDLFSAKGIGSLSFDFSSPVLAAEIVGEITPRQAALGQTTEFSLVLVPNMRPGIDQGFRSLEISTPVKVDAVHRIGMTLPDGSRREQNFSASDLHDLPVERGDFLIDLVEDDRFQISFPKVENSRIEADLMTVLDVDFECVVLRTGTAFSSLARSDTPGEVPQRVVGGNVVALIQAGAGANASLVRDPGNLVVQVAKKGALLININAVPSVFTPNGDQINDTAQIHFDITDLISGADVGVRIYDLSGSMVREVYRGIDQSGRFAKTWNGTDGRGKTVPPGLYIFKIDLDTDGGKAEASGLLGVAY